MALTYECLLKELVRIGEILRTRAWKNYKFIRVFRTRNCITFRCDGYTGGDEEEVQQPIIQVILRQHESIQHVLYGFDLGSCMMGWDGSDELVFTPLGKLAREYRLNVMAFHAMRISTNVYSRACKYHERGFSLALPKLNTHKLIHLQEEEEEEDTDKMVQCTPCLGFGRERLCILVDKSITKIDEHTGRITTVKKNTSALQYISPHLYRARVKDMQKQKQEQEEQEEEKEGDEEHEDDDDEEYNNDEANSMCHLRNDPPSGKLFDYTSVDHMKRHNLCFLQRTLRRSTFAYRNGLVGMALYDKDMDFTQVANYFEGLDVLLSRVCSPEHIDLIAVRRMLGRKEGNTLCQRIMASATVNRTKQSHLYWRKIIRHTITTLVHTLSTSTPRGQQYSSLPFEYNSVELDTTPITRHAVKRLDSLWYHGWQQE